MMRELLHIAPEVAAAMDANQQVVAIESTVIAHGLPRPTNIETAQRLESIVREVGAVPATIAITEGKLRVGLDGAQLRSLAEDSDVKKISTRDIPLAVAQSWTGATTVAATAMGIPRMPLTSNAK